VIATVAAVAGCLVCVCLVCCLIFRTEPADDDDQTSNFALSIVNRRLRSKSQTSSASSRKRLGSLDDDDEERGVVRPPQHEAKWSRVVTAGKALVTGLLVAGTAVPGLEGVCNLAVFVLYEVEQLHNKGDDVVSAGERIVKVLEVLKILAVNASRLDDDDAKAVVERRMLELQDLLDKFGRLVRSFREKGWLRRRWFLYEHGAKLSSLDAEIVQTLDLLRLAYDVARDRKMTTLLDAQTYALEVAIEKRVSRLVNAGQTTHDAVVLLAENDDATREVAVAAHVAQDELAPELAMALASVRSGLDDLRSDVQDLRDIITRHSTLATDDQSAGKRDAPADAETIEVDLESNSTSFNHQPDSLSTATASERRGSAAHVEFEVDGADHGGGDGGSGHRPVTRVRVTLGRG